MRVVWFVRTSKSTSCSLSPIFHNEIMSTRRMCLVFPKYRMPYTFYIYIYIPFSKQRVGERKGWGGGGGEEKVT